MLDKSTSNATIFGDDLNGKLNTQDNLTYSTRGTWLHKRYLTGINPEEGMKYFSKEELHLIKMVTGKNRVRF